MMPIILDFETYYSTEYSLSKMSTEAYVRDPRFEVICVGIQSVKTGHVQMVWGADAVRQTLESLPWEKIALVCQNTAFDGFILAEHYGIYPAMYCDTMSMFRRLYPHKRASLKVIAETLGLPSKGTEIVNAKGKRAKDFTPAEREAFLAYCALDCELTAKAWEILKAGFPVNELRLIDLTISMACKPYLRLNPAPLKEEIAEQKRIKEELLARVSTAKSDLMSNERFALQLIWLGVDPPRKISPTALKKNPSLAGDPDAPLTWAFGKTDKGMKALLNHDDPEVVALVEARLGVKSTIKETRAESMLGVANRGTLPVNLLYYGAHTGRWSGSGGLNLQNLTRGSRLRDAILPPEGEKLLVCDLSGIEMRVLAWLAGQGDVIDTVRSGGDVYCQMATSLYGRQITKKDKRERQLGKTIVLGCIAEGELVLTDKGLVPIEKVTVDMRVWDGVEWVSHTGVKYQGTKEVITYHGLTATRDHKVYLRTGGWREFAEAAENGLQIAQTGDGGQEIRLADDYQRRGSAAEHNSLCSDQMRLRESRVGSVLQRNQREGQRVSYVYGGSQSGVTQLAGSWEKIRCNSRSLPAATLSRLQRLRGQGHRIAVQQPVGVYSVGGNQSPAQRLQGCRDRQDRQQWALRSGQFATGRSTRTNGKPQEQPVHRVQWQTSLGGGCVPCNTNHRPDRPLRTGDHQKFSKSRLNGGRDNQSVSPFPVVQTKRTYDITNAGRRNRFTVSGLLVHNCGYSMSWKKFADYTMAMNMAFTAEDCDSMRIDMERAKIMTKEPNLTPHQAVAWYAVSTYRTANWAIAGLWREAEQALHAITAGRRVQVGHPDGVVFTSARGFETPDNGIILYPDLKLDGKSWTKSSKEGTSFLHGGLVVENIVQHLSRQILSWQMLQAKEAGLHIVLTCHDEIVCIAPEHEAEEQYEILEQIMKTAPKWAKGLPLDAEGGIGNNYGEAK